MTHVKIMTVAESYQYFSVFSQGVREKREVMPNNTKFNYF